MLTFTKHRAVGPIDLDTALVWMARAEEGEADAPRCEGHLAPLVEAAEPEVGVLPPWEGRTPWPQPDALRRRT